MQKAARWPCGVCVRDVGSNSYSLLVIRSGYTRSVVV